MNPLAHHIGNMQVWEKKRIGFLASSYVAPLSVLPTLDWAAQMAERDDVAIMSGFSSPTERDVLTFLSKGKCGIILVLARQHYKQLPEQWQTLLDAGRLLILSTTSAVRQSKAAACERNKYIIEQSDSINLPTRPQETSSLFELISATDSEVNYLF